MAYENLKSAIKQAIKQNGNQEITGNLLQSTLLSMVDNIPEIAQTTGGAEYKTMSQKATSTELAKKADNEEMNRLMATKANTDDVDTKFTEDKNRVDAELGKKFDKESVAQESGDAEDKVMSQKATTTAIADETARAKAAEEAIIFDVSEHNDGATFESLSALLGEANLSTLIPTSVRRGGMSIRFVQSSDNKYVQYRLMLSNLILLNLLMLLIGRVLMMNQLMEVII